MIVAEIGTVYANDDPTERVRQILVHAKAASECGANAVKVQMFVDGEPLFCHMPGDEVRWERWHKTHLLLDQWHKVYNICKTEYHIELFASAFQNVAVDWCVILGFKWHKVASRAIETYPYDKVADKDKYAHNILVSNGMKMDWPISPWGYRKLHCVSQYPAPLNRARMPEEECQNGYHWRQYDGISDHSGTSWPAIDALARGAEIVEVHFALDKELAGPDRAVCLDREQLKLICDFALAAEEMGCSE